MARIDTSQAQTKAEREAKRKAQREAQAKKLAEVKRKREEAAKRKEEADKKAAEAKQKAARAKVKAKLERRKPDPRTPGNIGEALREAFEKGKKKLLDLAERNPGRAERKRQAAREKQTEGESSDPEKKKSK